jgi:hypothetical protein
MKQTWNLCWLFSKTAHPLRHHTLSPDRPVRGRGGRTQNSSHVETEPDRIPACILGSGSNIANKGIYIIEAS